MTRGSGTATPPVLPIQIQEIVDNLAFTQTAVTSWYVLDPLHWAMRSAAQQEDAIVATAAAWAGLVGRGVHLRVTSRPHQPAVVAWARRHAQNTPAPLPAPPGVPTWAEDLTATQRRIQAITAPEKVVYVGVDVLTRSPLAQLAGQLLGRTGNREIDQVHKKLPDIDRALANMGGRRATAAEMEWLLHRSVGLGLPGPLHLSPVNHGRWEAGDLDEFADRITVTARPTGRTVRVTDRVTGADTHVCVLTYGRMDRIAIPDPARAPWMTASDRYGIFERSARLTVVGRNETGKRISRNSLRIRDQERQYGEHDLDPPPELVAKVAHTERIMYDLAEGNDGEATRVVGQHRIAITGPTEEACMDLVETLRGEYARRDMTLTVPKGQLRLVQEFTPGARLAAGTRAYRRELPALYIAAGLPAATSILGDDRGPYLGYAGTYSPRPVRFDPWYATEVLQMSGLVPVVGVQGSGKSALTGKIAYDAARAGITTTVFDPSGPLAELTRMPELAPYSQHIDLLSAPAGTLSPYTVVPEPPAWQEYLTDPDVAGVVDPEERQHLAVRLREEAVWEAEELRRQLAEDVLRLLLPLRQVDNPQTDPVLTRALRPADGSINRSLWDVVEQLRRQAADYDSSTREHAGILADLTEDIARGLHGRLFFPDPDHPTQSLSHADPTLLVITLSGIQLPDRSTSPATWTKVQRVSVPLLHLAAYYATNRVYLRGRHERKAIVLDEVGLMAGWSSGKALFNRLARDTRKWNVAALLVSQDPSDILGMDIGNHVSTAFVGKIEAGEHVADALNLLRLPPGSGFEGVIRGLSPEAIRDRDPSRRFLMKDVHGRSDIVVIDLAANPRLLAALNTTADPHRHTQHRHAMPTAAQGAPA